MSSVPLWSRGLFRANALATACLVLASCTSGDSGVLSSAVKSSPSHINTKTKFSESSYGVAASPRLTTSLKVRKGGGRRQVGKPYKIKGKWYTPKEEPGYDRKGQASWYGPNFHGRLTANGEIYDQFALSGAHPTFPLPSYARVTNRKNGKSVVVRVNDRGPYHEGRVIDLSARAAELLNYQHAGVAQVRVQYIGPAPLHGLDNDYLVASFRPGVGKDGEPVDPPSVMVAYNGQTPRAAVGPIPPAPLSSRRRLDRVVTGSIAKSNAMVDFFSDQLKAVAERRQDNSTISLRLTRERGRHSP